MDNEKEPAKFLTDKSEASEDHNYIQPNVELKLRADKRNECREIVREIKDFGITQRQLLYLIYLLSLELENNEVMRELAKAIGENREKIPLADQEKVKPKILLPNS